MSISFNSYKALRRLRIAVSIAVMLAVFVAVAFGYDLWLCRWQLAPAALAGTFIWIILWLMATAIFGRVYCSSVCPFGTVLDTFGWLAHRKKGYFYSPSHTLARRSITAIAVAALLLGIPAMLDLIEPAAAFSRMAAWSLGPLVRPVAFSLGAGCAAFATLCIAAAVAAARGRLLCNTVCPVGAILAEISRFSLYHIDINTDKCIGCGRCTERCKAECIDPSAHTVDAARCVVCFDCTAVCPNSAITYRRGRHRLVMPMLQTTEPMQCSPDSPGPSSGTLDQEKPAVDRGRRKFLASLAQGIPAIALAAAPADPDLEPLNPVHPPGLRSAETLNLRCTACGACSAACPSGIIRPSSGLRSPLRPVLEFETGPCIYDCTRCTQVCPTGTLQPLTVSEKHIFVIGQARVVPKFCREYTEGTGCGKCVRLCPRKAIKLVTVDHPEATPGHPASHPELTPSGRPRRLPMIDSSLCIGCGACRYYCPSRPRAFIIEGES